ncbi:membrane-flanked domain-containing protein [Neobacillus bataviensis LMG 21833]|uniref:Membrane-flanked domain-containing protein n=1 Tax=Neobacillus bataviensis LMG 21833 TaxID=1117379 RepID=K6E146_9BACI|nr:PH domain-containing protein [Neobacillus bataviensis]EKN66891.1 membrane-flanked domain-containing protein [Neobacillus bataviensis LMG 21833]
MEEKDLWMGKSFFFGFPSFTKYRITNQRLIIEKGVFTKIISEIELFRVRDIQVKRNLVERIFGFGDITVLSTDHMNSVILLKNIKKSVEVKDIIRNAVMEQRNSQRLEIDDIHQ